MRYEEAERIIDELNDTFSRVESLVNDINSIDYIENKKGEMVATTDDSDIEGWILELTAVKEDIDIVIDNLQRTL